jgi:hypothetical protein
VDFALKDNEVLIQAVSWSDVELLIPTWTLESVANNSVSMHHTNNDIYINFQFACREHIWLQNLLRFEFPRTIVDNFTRRDVRLGALRLKKYLCSPLIPYVQSKCRLSHELVVSPLCSPIFS